MRFLATLFLWLSTMTAQQPPSAQQPSLTKQPSSAKPANDGQSNQDKARAVIDKMIATLGGQAYLNVQDVYMEGRYGRFHNDTMVASNPFYRYWQWPDNERYEITDKRDIAYLYQDGKEYEITYKGAVELNPEKDEGVKEALVRRRFTLAKVLREWLKDPATILLDEGPALAEGQMTERVTIVNARNEAVTLLVSADTHLPVRKVFSVRDPQSRDRDEEVETYGGWRFVDGVNTPWSVQLSRNGVALRSESISAVVYNKRPAENVFTPKLIRHANDKKKK